MWMLQKQVLLGGLQVYAYYSETIVDPVRRTGQMAVLT
jgi:hypothetical protein